MPTKRTRRGHAWRPALSQWQISELLTGKLKYPVHGVYDGYGDGEGYDLRAFLGERMNHSGNSIETGCCGFGSVGGGVQI